MLILAFIKKLFPEIVFTTKFVVGACGAVAYICYFKFFFGRFIVLRWWISAKKSIISKNPLNSYKQITRRRCGDGKNEIACSLLCSHFFFFYVILFVVVCQYITLLYYIYFLSLHFSYLFFLPIRYFLN